MRNETYYSRDGSRIAHWWDRGGGYDLQYGLRFTFKGRIRDTQNESAAQSITEARSRCREYTAKRMK